MIRNAFKMKLNPGCLEEYKRRHDALWPELDKALKESGLVEYVIALDEESNSLFAFQVLTDENKTAELPGLEIMKKWWHYMGDIMETNPDESPVCISLTEVFWRDYKGK